ncbi:dephospho-CoA kinase domain-containing protein-like [Ornithodoros turicata]|uniref:dephospho-CoA kinase domain-containing protein-like n=1 Tax=Ornithodoros turicata TaxID=34597 RepID=UPI0031387034
MFLVGLTGGIATGKSTVASMLRGLHVEVIDADQVARQVVEPGTRAWKKIRHEFGDEVILDNGQIDRSLLGRIIFADPEKRRRLNSITHPEIYRSIGWKCLYLMFRAHQFVVIDLPLLYETKGMLPYINKVIVVSCSSKQQLDRLIARNGYTEEEAKSRIEAQLPLSDKCAMADFVVDNTQDEQHARRQVVEIVDKLKSSYTHWKVRTILLCFLAGVVGSLTWVLSHL